MAYDFFFRRDPTPEKELLLDNVEWPPATGANYSFLDVGLRGQFTVNEEGFYSERMALWDSILEELDVDTFSHNRNFDNREGDQIKDEL